MTFLVDTPYVTAYVRNEFLFDEQEGHGEFTPCTVFGFRAEPARVPLFQVMLDNGAMWARVPIHMLCNKPCAALPIDISCWWDSFSHHCTVHAFAFLKNHAVSCLGRDKEVRRGNYLFTVDWQGRWAEAPDQHKNHHVIALDSGQWIAYPNNRLIWEDPSWIKPSKIPAWKSPTRNYYCEFLAQTTNKET